jgi:hypothetical protein
MRLVVHNWLDAFEENKHPRDPKGEFAKGSSEREQARMDIHVNRTLHAAIKFRGKVYKAEPFERHVDLVDKIRQEHNLSQEEFEEELGEPMENIGYAERGSSKRYVPMKTVA